MADTVIELDRTFLPFHERDDIDAGLAMRIARAAGHELCWQDVLDERYVVILGEAGAGKTTEFQARAAMLRRTNAAVFARLAELAADGLDLSLSPEDADCLGRWRAGTGDCYFFLDALDEAKLTRQTLAQALRQLRRALGEAFHRARLLISCRPSDWRPGTDLRELKAVLQPGDERVKVRLLQISPLDDRQVRLLATHAGVSDVVTLMDAIHTADVEALVGRPQDVKWLAAFWRRRGRLGSLQELIEENITNKLQEIRDTDSTLSVEQARRGALALAGIATLSGRSTILIPDGGTDAAQLTTSIDPAAVLPAWSNDDRRQLLTRGLFDEATYGRVRFHERRVREYLAAQWLANLDNAGLPRRELNRLLFRSSLGRTVVPQILGPTAAWLSLKDSRVRSTMTRVAPEHLIDEGDPGRLYIEDRASVLRSYCDKYRGRRRVGHRFDQAGLQRFAADGLAPTVNDLIATVPGDAVSSFLLELVAAGRLSSCVPAALRVALDSSASADVRHEAVMAVGAAGSAIERTTLARAMIEQASVDNELAAAVMMALFPDPLDVPRLVRLLERVPSKPEHTLTLMDTAIGHEIPSRCSREQRLELLCALLAMVQPAAGGPDRGWLLGGLAQLLVDELEQHTSEDGLPEPIVLAVDLFQRQYRGTLGASAATRTVKEAVARQSWMRRLAFWRRYRAGLQRGEPLMEFLADVHVHGHLLSRLTPDDADWLAQDARVPSVKYIHPAATITSPHHVD